VFIRNRWYVAGWDREISRTPTARTICGEAVVLYRRLDGSALALEDACPHRLLPLSMGCVEDDGIRCGYHGLKLDDQGRAVEMPGQETPPERLRARTYPVTERYRFVWVWIGDPARADPALLPDLWVCEHPDWAFDGDVYPVKCDYRLLVDNLMDLSHETYVHPSSIGQQEITVAPIDTRLDGQQVIVERWMKAIEPPPFWRTFLGRDGLVDRWQICRFMLPSAVAIEVGVAPVGTGAPEGDRSSGVEGVVVNFMTPESETTCRYYWGMARAFGVDDEALTGQMREAQAGVFAEDVVVLEAQQRAIDARPGVRLANLAVDAGGVLARSLIERAARMTVA
jgi:phenylpropionate dioxygenase-like ring-hydroxylating dioxygenase large terminal subunit